MRRLTLLFFTVVLAMQMQSNGETWIVREKDSCHGDHNDLIPILRVGVTPRFFEDTTAITFLGEVGNLENRYNVSFGFPLFNDCEAALKIGGEILNEQLRFQFPCNDAKGWARQYAWGIAYRTPLDFCGLRGLEFAGQWSNAQGHDLHRFRQKKHHSIKSSKLSSHSSCHHPSTFNQWINGSKAYALSAGFAVEPWYWGTFNVAVVYDRVKYERKIPHHKINFFKHKQHKSKSSHHKVVEGVGGIVYFNQLLSPSFSLAFTGEFRAPYDYYEANLLWRTCLASTDVIIGAFAGHTSGRKCLPDTTVAGLEIGFDFGLTELSFSRSVGICWNSPDAHCQSSLGGLSRHYLEWLATPTVYVPQVLAIGEQHRAARHNGHHHGGHNH